MNNKKFLADKKFLILGHARHGKDTVANLIAEMLEIKTISSSLFAAHVVRPVLADLGKNYNTIEECFEDRVNHRGIWKKAISAFNTPDKSKLTKAILKENNIYVGMRDLEEYKASKHLFDYIIWVDASLRWPKKDITMSIEFDAKEMLYLHNNFDLIQLKEAVQELLDILTIQQFRIS